jgi:protoporphyrin/coproporphyrin ferrochelatase
VADNAKTAVVLFNLGGPDGPEAVEPFLRNLFSDPAIIGLPNPFRALLARRIAAKRAPIARAIYGEIGGGSPILANTEVQARALEAKLGGTARVFIAMRYWQPRSEAAAGAVKEWGSDRVVLLPLYPQYSTTTTESSLADWEQAARDVGLDVPTQLVCCYPCEPGFIEAMAVRCVPKIAEARKAGSAGLRVLFSAHGLPKRVIARGDPYQWQIEQSAAAIARRLGLAEDDWVVCYQSRVGRLQWIGPSTDEEITRAGADGVAVVVVPLSFVCEHSETLVELDIEYAKLAKTAGVPAYLRVPTVDDEAAFIEGLARLVQAATAAATPCVSGDGGRLCPAEWSRCPLVQSDGTFVMPLGT